VRDIFLFFGGGGGGGGGIGFVIICGRFEGRSELICLCWEGRYCVMFLLSRLRFRPPLCCTVPKYKWFSFDAAFKTFPYTCAILCIFGCNVNRKWDTGGEWRFSLSFQCHSHPTSGTIMKTFRAKKYVFFNANLKKIIILLLTKKLTRKCFTSKNLTTNYNIVIWIFKKVCKRFQIVF